MVELVIHLDWLVQINAIYFGQIDRRKLFRFWKHLVTNRYPSTVRQSYCRIDIFMWLAEPADLTIFVIFIGK